MGIPKFKFDERKYLKEIEKYIEKTYSQHYASNEQQTFEIIEAAGWGDGFAIGNIIKYASRYGKKSGYQRKDLIKIAHYTLLQLYIHDNNPNHNNITIERLEELFDWDEKTGEAYWKVDKGNNRKGRHDGSICRKE